MPHYHLKSDSDVGPTYTLFHESLANCGSWSGSNGIATCNKPVLFPSCPRFLTVVKQINSPLLHIGESFPSLSALPCHHLTSSNQLSFTKGSRVILTPTVFQVVTK